MLVCNKICQVDWLHRFIARVYVGRNIVQLFSIFTNKGVKAVTAHWCRHSTRSSTDYSTYSRHILLTTNIISIYISQQCFQYFSINYINYNKYIVYSNATNQYQVHCRDIYQYHFDSLAWVSPYNARRYCFSSYLFIDSN